MIRKTEVDRQLDELLKTRMSDLFSTSVASRVHVDNMEEERLVGLDRAEFERMKLRNRDTIEP